MSISLGISHLALSNPPARTTLRSGCFSFSSQRWKENTVTTFSLRVWPNSGGRPLMQEEGIAARKGLSTEFAADGGEFFEDVHVGYRGGGGAALRAAPQRSNGRFWRRFPGPPQRGSQDAIVPIEALRRGAVFRGTVSSVQPFGAFVSFGAFADGLVHISKLSTGYVKNVGDVVELGQEVMVSIVNVEASTGRISLSLLEKDHIDVTKPYVSPRLEATRHGGERPRFQSGSEGSAVTIWEREERVSNGSYASSSRSMGFREGAERPRYQPGSMPEEESERFSSDPNGSSRHREARRGGGARPSFQPGSGQRYPFTVEEEEKIAWNSIASARLGEAREGDRLSNNPFAAPRKVQSSGEERQSRNSFASSRQGEAQEEGRTSRNSSVSSLRREPGEEWSSDRFQRQGNEGNFNSGGGSTRVGIRAGRESQTKPKMKLVQIQRDGNSVEDKVSSRMRQATNSWYECGCCY